jgi:hypothetical protein
MGCTKESLLAILPKLKKMLLDKHNSQWDAPRKIEYRTFLFYIKAGDYP